MHRARRPWLSLVVAALAVLVVLPAAASPAAAATSNWTAKCDLRIRTAPKLSSTTLRIVDKGTVVAATGTVTGSSYRADCGGSVSGSSWLKITAINA